MIAEKPAGTKSQVETFKRLLEHFDADALRAELDLVPDICRKLRARGDVRTAEKIEKLASIVAECLKS